MPCRGMPRHARLPHPHPRQRAVLPPRCTCRTAPAFWRRRSPYLRLVGLAWTYGMPAFTSLRTMDPHLTAPSPVRGPSCPAGLPPMPLRHARSRRMPQWQTHAGAARGRRRAGEGLAPQSVAQRAVQPRPTVWMRAAGPQVPYVGWLLDLFSLWMGENRLAACSALCTPLLCPGCYGVGTQPCAPPANAPTRPCARPFRCPCSAQGHQDVFWLPRLPPAPLPGRPLPAFCAAAGQPRRLLRHRNPDPPGHAAPHG